MAKVLVVDDGAFNRVLLTTSLKDEGYTVEVAKNGHQALELLQKEPFDVVLLDLIMPEMNGLEVLEHLQADQELRAIPVIVVSGEEQTEDLLRGIEMGATDRLKRPFAPELLHARVKTALAVKRLHDLESGCLQDATIVTNVTLPQAPKPDEAGRPSEIIIEPAPDTTGISSSVLVVDDSALNRILLANNLNKVGYTVYQAENGLEALEMLQAHSFDVVLLDLLMPEMDGFEVLQQMKNLPRLRDVPVIVISAADESENVVRSIEMGATDYLPKPFDPLILRARLDASLAAKRLRDQEIEYLYNVRLLTDAAATVKEEKDFDPQILNEVAERPDALGQLARVFQHMASELYARQKRLQQQVHKLRIELDEAKQQAQVAAVTGTDYFRNLDALPKESGKTKIITIHSFRGGTGKSNVTANIAVLLASAGQRVGVVDSDVQSPGIHILFGIAGEEFDYTLNDFLWGKCEIKQAVHEVGTDLNADLKGQILLIPASIKPGAIARVLREGYDAKVLTQGFDQLAEELNLDVLLIDTHPGLNEETLLSIVISHTVVIVLRPDQQDYEGTGVAIQVARKLNVSRMSLVVNKVPPFFDPEAVKYQMKRAYNCPISAILNHSEEMMALASGGIFVLKYPDHPITALLQELVADLMS